MPRGKFAVALGGGGARGFAHIGVLCAMDTQGIRPDLIVGTSMGAIVGGLYAHLGSARQIFDHLGNFIENGPYDTGRYSRLVQMEMAGEQSLLAQVKRFILSSITYGKTIFRESIISPDEYAAGIDALIPDVRIEDLGIPFACVALDLHSAEEVIIERGSLRRAVMASCAIPGIYPPVEEDGKVLVDGGWVDRTPVPAARWLGATKVLAVDVSHGIFPDKELDTAINIILRANLIAVDRLDLMQIQGADVCLRPELEDFHSMEFDQLDRIVQEGYRCGREASKSIMRLYRQTRRRQWHVLRRGRVDGFSWPAEFKLVNMPDKPGPAGGSAAKDAGEEA
jgi:NTE family protein